MSKMATAKYVAVEVRSNESFEPNLGSNASSNYARYAPTILDHLLDSDDLSELKKAAQKDQLEEDQFLEESKIFNEKNIKNCKIPQGLLRKLKIYIYILSQKKSEFVVDDLKAEFNDNFEIPDKVDLEDELWKLGIVKLKWCTSSGGDKVKMIATTKFIDDYYEQKSNAKVNK